MIVEFAPKDTPIGSPLHLDILTEELPIFDWTVIIILKVLPVQFPDFGVIV